MSDIPYLSLMVFIPLAGAFLLLVLPNGQLSVLRGTATAVAALPVLIAALMALNWGTAGVDGYRFVESVDWIPSFGIRYAMGTDGISFAMLALSAVIFLIAAIASYGIQTRVKEYFVLLLILETAVLGVFSALDLILFYLFWEAVLIPMYFLIAIWGGERREYAALKFLIYTLVGSLLMLVAIVAAYLYTGGETFSIVEITGRLGTAPETARWLMFLAFFVGFAVKVPVFPFHTWLPDAHVQAPTPVSVILAAVLLKMGAYGFLRISHPFFPEVAKDFAWTLAVLGIINILYGSLAALSQSDMKRLVAYSSVNHMGFVLLGIAVLQPITVNAAVFVMVSHGIISALLFLMVGVFYDRTHTREMPRMGGFYIITPAAGGILTFTAMANLGLPGLSGFIGEFFTLLGMIDVYRTLVYLAVVGLVITAAFNLVMLYKVLMGEPKEEWKGLPDLSSRELVTLVPLMVLTMLLGLWPGPLMSLLDAPIGELIARMGGM